MLLQSRNKKVGLGRGGGLCFSGGKHLLRGKKWRKELHVLRGLRKTSSTGKMKIGETPLCI